MAAGKLVSSSRPTDGICPECKGVMVLRLSLQIHGARKLFALVEAKELCEPCDIEGRKVESLQWGKDGRLTVRLHPMEVQELVVSLPSVLAQGLESSAGKGPCPECLKHGIGKPRGIPAPCETCGWMGIFPEAYQPVRCSCYLTNHTHGVEERGQDKCGNLVEAEDAVLWHGRLWPICANCRNTITAHRETVYSIRLEPEANALAWGVRGNLRLFGRGGKERCPGCNQYRGHWDQCKLGEDMPLLRCDACSIRLTPEHVTVTTFMDIATEKEDYAYHCHGCHEALRSNVCLCKRCGSQTATPTRHPSGKLHCVQCATVVAQEEERRKAAEELEGKCAVCQDPVPFGLATCSPLCTAVLVKRDRRVPRWTKAEVAKELFHSVCAICQLEKSVGTSLARLGGGRVFVCTACWPAANKVLEVGPGSPEVCIQVGDPCPVCQRKTYAKIVNGTAEPGCLVCPSCYKCGKPCGGSLTITQGEHVQHYCERCCVGLDVSEVVGSAPVTSKVEVGELEDCKTCEHREACDNDRGPSACVKDGTVLWQEGDPEPPTSLEDREARCVSCEHGRGGGCAAEADEGKGRTRVMYCGSFQALQCNGCGTTDEVLPAGENLAYCQPCLKKRLGEEWGLMVCLFCGEQVDPDGEEVLRFDREGRWMHQTCLEKKYCGICWRRFISARSVDFPMEGITCQACEDLRAEEVQRIKDLAETPLRRLDELDGVRGATTGRFSAKHPNQASTPSGGEHPPGKARCGGCHHGKDPEVCDLGLDKGVMVCKAWQTEGKATVRDVEGGVPCPGCGAIGLHDFGCGHGMKEE